MKPNSGVVGKIPTDFYLSIFSRKPEDVKTLPHSTVVTLSKPIPKNNG